MKEEHQAKVFMQDGADLNNEFHIKAVQVMSELGRKLGVHRHWAWDLALGNEVLFLTAFSHRYFVL